ncbi:MAG: biotin/lipoyl-containing protein, partial [Rhodanobacteraceae bacterium]
ECEIVGPKSNITFLERLVRHPAIVEGSIDTGYLDRHLDEFVDAPNDDDPTALFAAATLWLLHEETATQRAAANSADPHSPWAEADGWRLGHPGKRIVMLVERERQHEVIAHGSAGHYQLECGERSCAIAGAELADGVFNARFDGSAHRFVAHVDAERIFVHDGAGRHRFDHAPAFAYSVAEAGGGDRVLAPMPGRIVLVKVAVGDEVAEKQDLLVMEAMKMELTLRAPRAGIIEAVQAAVDDFVEADATLVRLEPGA